MSRVVITGMGIYSSIGQDLESVTHSLRNGISGIGIDPERKEHGFRSALTGILPEPELKPLLSRRQRTGLPDQGGYAYISTRQALEMAGITDAILDEEAIGILYGNDSSAKPVSQALDQLRIKKDTTLIGSGAIFQGMNSTVSMNLSTIFRLKGINMTISAACASGSHSIGLGYILIKHGLQNKIICGGAQEVNYQSMGSFDGLSTFSTREDKPSEASRPFDTGRDGLIPSGGAATVILESLESAKKRGANILGEVIGYGFSSNGKHISHPDSEGSASAIRIALQDAALTPKDIPYINAHATSTPAGDIQEGKAILEVFGNNGPLISSTKSMTGHEMWMAGASEIVYSLLMMHNGFIAPNINLQNVDSELANLAIAKTTINQEFDLFLSNSFGFGGTNSSLIIKKYDD